MIKSGYSSKTNHHIFIDTDKKEYKVIESHYNGNVLIEHDTTDILGSMFLSNFFHDSEVQEIMDILRQEYKASLYDI